MAWLTAKGQPHPAKGALQRRLHMRQLVKRNCFEKVLIQWPPANRRPRLASENDPRAASPASAGTIPQAEDSREVLSEARKADVAWQTGFVGSRTLAYRERERLP